MAGSDARVAGVVESLAEEVRRIEGARPLWSAEVVSSGSPDLDRLLPGGGFRRGSLIEWLAGGAASGAATLALWAAVQAAGSCGTVVVIDRQAQFYPPAVLSLGLRLEQLVVVRPSSQADEQWALDQTLRSRGVAAAWCWLSQTDDHTLRRWQLAVETSGVLGMLVRDAGARDEPSWAEVRLGVQPIAASPPALRGVPVTQAVGGRQRRVRVELLRARQAEVGRSAIVELPCQRVGPPLEDASKRASKENTWDESGVVPVAATLAAAKTGRRSRRA